MTTTLKRNPLQTTRGICALKTDRIWHEIMLLEKKTNSGIEVPKLVKSISEKFNKVSEEEWTTAISNACRDGLLTFGERAGKDGETLSVVGRPTSALPDAEKGDRDWFCFKCHKHGDLVRCRDCSKAYHLECLPKNWATVIFGVMGRICPSCEMIYNKPSMSKIPDTKMLNELIVFLINPIKGYEIPLLNNSVGFEWVKAINCTDSEGWRFSYMIYSPIDFTVMHNKASQGRYLSLEEFQVDCETLAHNMGVFFGVEILEKRRIGHEFLTTVQYDIAEIKLCHDCFYHANKKEDQWFCKPCSVPHELVWAKMPHFLWWPAKVLKKFDNNYDVRFFGEPYSRKVLPASQVQPITASLKKSGQSKNYKQAVAELELLQKLQNQIVTG